jgi:hypothetical protein
MKAWPFAVVGLVCLVLAGCRTDPTAALLERQNRMLEDENYRLRGIIQDFEEGTSQTCGQENIVETGPVQNETITPRDSVVKPGRWFQSRDNRSPSAQSVQPPIVEMPSEAQPPGKIPDTLKRPAGTRAPDEPGKLDAPGTLQYQERPSGPSLPGSPGPDKTSSYRSDQLHLAGRFESISNADSKDVGQLVLNHMLTGGYNTDGRSGDNGVLVVLESRDAKGRRLEAPGDVSVVVIDPAKNGPEARQAIWDFSAIDTMQFFRGSGVSRGMYIECPWPDNPPEHNRLHLFVRYITSDGRKLQVDQPIEVSLPGEKVSRWTPSKTDDQSAQQTDFELAEDQTNAGTAEADSADSDASDSSTPRPARSMRTASRDNGTQLQRPVWSPERF